MKSIFRLLRCENEFSRFKNLLPKEAIFNGLQIFVSCLSKIVCLMWSVGRKKSFSDCGMITLNNLINHHSEIIGRCVIIHVILNRVFLALLYALHKYCGLQLWKKNQVWYIIALLSCLTRVSTLNNRANHTIMHIKHSMKSINRIHNLIRFIKLLLIKNFSWY